MYQFYYNCNDDFETPNNCNIIQTEIDNIYYILLAIQRLLSVKLRHYKYLIFNFLVTSVLCIILINVGISCATQAAHHTLHMQAHRP